MFNLSRDSSLLGCILSGTEIDENLQMFNLIDYLWFLFSYFHQTIENLVFGNSR